MLPKLQGPKYQLGQVMRLNSVISDHRVTAPWDNIIILLVHVEPHLTADGINGMENQLFSQLLQQYSLHQYIHLYCMLLQ